MSDCPTNTHVPSERNPIKGYADAMWPSIEKFEALLASLKLAHANLNIPCKSCVDVRLLAGYGRRVQEMRNEMTLLVRVFEYVNRAIGMDRRKWPRAERNEAEWYGREEDEA
jgi:hypothetical protein